MTSAATALQSQQLVGNITEYQRGVYEDMHPFVIARDPLENLLKTMKDDVVGYANELFTPLHAAITAWFNVWGLGRLIELLALAPCMEPRVIAHALWSGNLSVLTMLPVESVRAAPNCVVAFAALQPDKRVLEYLHDVVGFAVSSPRAMYYAAQSGHLDVIRYLYELNNDIDVRVAASAAAHHGHVEAVEFFHTHCASCDLDDAFLCAIEHDRLAVAQYILDLVGKDDLDGLRPMDYAAAAGRMASLEWLHQRGFTRATYAMDDAAENGHLEVVQWLHANRSEEAAMNSAVANGHLAVVEFLFFYRREGCNANALLMATCLRRWDVVRFLVTHGVVSDTQEALKSARLRLMENAPVDVVALLDSAVVKSSPPQRKKFCRRWLE